MVLVRPREAGLGVGILAPGSLSSTSDVTTWSRLSCWKSDDGSMGVVAEEDVLGKDVEVLLLLFSLVESTWK